MAGWVGVDPLRLSLDAPESMPYTVHMPLVILIILVSLLMLVL